MDKTEMDNRFGTEDHAALYAKYRAKPPQCILNHILAYLGQEFSPPFGQALDVGCGSGQSTDLLANNFERVTGLDISEAQIQEAIKGNKFENISFKVGTETRLPFESKRLQLVTASQCFQWLDLPAFYEEVKRVLLPNGVVCIYFYQLPYFIDEANDGSDLRDILKHVNLVALAGFGDPRRRKVREGLDNFYFPFDDVVKERFTVDRVMTVSQACGYVTSWSVYQDMFKASPESAKKVVDDFREKLLIASDSENQNPDEIELAIRYPYCSIIGRVRSTYQKA